MSELTKNERESIAHFIKVYFIDSIHNDHDLDDLELVCDICSAYRKLKEVEE